METHFENASCVSGATPLNKLFLLLVTIVPWNSLICRDMNWAYLTSGRLGVIFPLYPGKRSQPCLRISIFLAEVP